MHSHGRSGIVLVLVLIVIAMLALSGLAFSNLMLEERKTVVVSGRRIQARRLAESGVEKARQFLDRDPTSRNDVGGSYDNPQMFANVLVADDDFPRDRGRFTIVAPRIIDRTSNGVRNGLEDECNRINLCTLLNADKGSGSTSQSKSTLMSLPGMTDDVADAILDWIDKDDTPREQGAEVDYYSSLVPPYAPRNGVPASIEELLLVRGVTPLLLFGNDAARKAQAPMSLLMETATSNSDVDNSDGSMDHGWAAYLTIYSLESTNGPDGNPKVNLNGKDLQSLYTSLQQAFGDQWATFIVAYRQNGPYQASSQSSSQSGQQSSQSGQQSTGQSSSQSGQQSGGQSSGQQSSPQAVQSIGGKSGTSVQQVGGLSNSQSSGGSSGQSSQQSSGQSGGQSGGQSSTQSSSQSSDQSGPATGTLDFSKKATTTLTSVLDLIGVKTAVTFKGQKNATVLTSPFSADTGSMGSYLPQLLDGTTTSSGKVIAGRVNINQAPRVVLASIPGMPPDAVDQIIGQRVSDPTQAAANNPEQHYETWILTQGIVSLKDMKALLPYVCAGGCVYRAQVIGHFDEGTMSSRIEVIFDASKQPTRILSWKDVSYLGVYPGEIMPLGTEGSGGQ